MGYTNYWTQTRDFTEEEWKQIKSEAHYVKDIDREYALKNVVIDNDQVLFYGDCETFRLYKKIENNRIEGYEEQDITFNCCKTRECPYDLAVWHMLVFCAGMINNTKEFNISRDR